MVLNRLRINAQRLAMIILLNKAADYNIIKLSDLLIS